jgi:hypothetical protein
VKAQVVASKMNIDDQYTEEFLKRHNDSLEPNVEELLKEIRDARVRLTSYSPEVSSAELAYTYELRSEIAFGQQRFADARQMKVLAERCRANGGNPSSIWYFSGGEGSFAVFELLPSRHIAVCLKMKGDNAEFKQNDA